MEITTERRVCSIQLGHAGLLRRGELERRILMQHEQGLDSREVHRLCAYFEERLQRIADDRPSTAVGLRRAADFLEELAEELKERAASVGLPYPPDEA